jgi:hypothetical protein
MKKSDFFSIVIWTFTFSLLDPERSKDNELSTENFYRINDSLGRYVKTLHLQ